MSIKNYDDLSSFHIDVLREIGSIGTGGATGALSDLMGKPVTMKVPNVRILDYAEAIEVSGGAEKIVVGIIVTLSEDIDGLLLFLIEEVFASTVLSNLITDNTFNIAAMNEIEISVISEIGNIMAGAYLRGVAQLSGLTIDMSCPALTVDMLGAIMSVPAVQFSSVGDKVLYIDDRFVIDGVEINSNMILVPEISSLDILLTKLGVNNVG